MEIYRDRIATSSNQKDSVNPRALAEGVPTMEQRITQSNIYPQHGPGPSETLFNHRSAISERREGADKSW